MFKFRKKLQKKTNALYRKNNSNKGLYIKEVSKTINFARLNSI